MKHIMSLILALALLCSCSIAGAEVISLAGSSSEKVKLGSEIMIDEVCCFTVHSVKEYDVFMNIPSGDDKQFLVVSFDFMNLMTDQLFLKSQMKANLCYDDSFDFEATYLWASPEGSYYSTGAKNTLYIYDMDENGVISSNGTDEGGGLEKPSVNFSSGYSRIYDPINNSFYYPVDTHDNQWAYHSQDASKTVFDPLVERTMFYVFQVPEIVAEDEGLRELTLTVDGEEFYLIF